MKNLLKFKKAVSKKGEGLNNPLISKIIEQVGFDKSLIPAYSKQVKASSLYLNNQKFKEFIDSLNGVVSKAIQEKDTEESRKDSAELKKDLLNQNRSLINARDNKFENEVIALNSNDMTELEDVDIKIKADKKEIARIKSEKKALLLELELKYKKEQGYLI